MKHCKNIFLFALVITLCPNLLAVDIGSDSAVNRFETQQVLNDGDRIAGFAALEAGFLLSDATVTGTFDSFFPVSGEIDLNEGALFLGRDLVFRDTSTFKALGDIIGDEHSLELSASVTKVPLEGSATAYTFSDLKFFMNANLLLSNCYISFSGDSLLNGRGNCLTLDSSCTLEVASGSSLLIKDITIEGLNDTKIQCADALSTVSFQDVELIQNADYTFAVGKFDILKDLVLIGEGHTFVYQTDQVSTVSTYGRLIVENGMTFSYDPPVASRELLKLHEETSELILNGATLYTTSTGMRLTTGRLIIDRFSSLSNEGTVDAESISFATDLDVQWLPAANLDYVQGRVVYE